MNFNEIVKDLRTMSSEKYKENIIKLGIPAENCIGVSTVDIRKYAKKIEKSQKLAMELWNTRLHEAKILAVLLFNKKETTIGDIKILMQDVLSWDLCDHLCKNLIFYIPEYKTLIYEWCDYSEIYYKRASFTLIATTLIHDKNLTSAEIDKFLYIIKVYSNDDRLHVKKAISWALREIGKRDFESQEKALLSAYELKESDNKNMIWIGKDVIKELETLVNVDGRTRLITSKSRMGGKN